MQSIAKAVGSVTFPEYTGAQVYMVEATPETVADVAPAQYVAMIIQSIKDAMIAAGTKFFLTIDEREVQEGTAHRRGGAHIDGNFLYGWGGGGGNGWLNGVPGRILTPEQHSAQYLSEMGGTIIATNYPGCKVWSGSYNSEPGRGGSCEHFRDELETMDQFTMEPNKAYLMNSTCVHQSMPLDRTVKRQLVRLTLDNTVQVTQ
ncbi:hypothetical protein ST201phi2-1p185 [Pseudomonas phage 201phi2-1]|uniref:Uncharacterized protein n=1 Tax=Pseudomonas phage 201phi2-1 TaxID=198110 RepID=B3FJ48_BP201|nr:hypothetical protein ST201phi2-1p185 [Pseudomonas phage 201phi2-1]ABY63015.1 hypothetical protein 201phi2-1p185 [Pseudomonas phage 201phi2-1]